MNLAAQRGEDLPGIGIEANDRSALLLKATCICPSMSCKTWVAYPAVIGYPGFRPMASMITSIEAQPGRRRLVLTAPARTQQLLFISQCWLLHIDVVCRARTGSPHARGYLSSHVIRERDYLRGALRRGRHNGL